MTKLDAAAALNRSFASDTSDAPAGGE